MARTRPFADLRFVNKRTRTREYATMTNFTTDMLTLPITHDSAGASPRGYPIRRPGGHDVLGPRTAPELLDRALLDDVDDLAHGFIKFVVGHEVVVAAVVTGEADFAVGFGEAFGLLLL